jgi:hypothetical protein
VISNGASPSHAKNHKSKLGNDRTIDRAEAVTRENSALVGALLRKIIRIEDLRLGAVMATASCMPLSLTDELPLTSKAVNRISGSHSSFTKI